MTCVSILAADVRLQWLCSTWWGKKFKRKIQPFYSSLKEGDPERLIFFPFLRESWLHTCSSGTDSADTHCLWCRLQCRTREDSSISALSPLYAQHSAYLINQMQWCHHWFIQAWSIIQKITSKISIQFGNNIKGFNANLHMECKASAWMMWIAYHWFLLFL